MRSKWCSIWTRRCVDVGRGSCLPSVAMWVFWSITTVYFLSLWSPIQLVRWWLATSSRFASRSIHSLNCLTNLALASSLSCWRCMRLLKIINIRWNLEDWPWMYWRLPLLHPNSRGRQNSSPEKWSLMHKRASRSRCPSSVWRYRIFGRDCVRRYWSVPKWNSWRKCSNCNPRDFVWRIFRCWFRSTSQGNNFRPI